MHSFHNILFVSHGLGGDEYALRQALKLACDNQASLTILIACPPFPENLGDYKASYEKSLVQQMEQAVKSEKSSLKISRKKLSICVKLECGSAPDVRIIRHVLRSSHDLLIKQAETDENQKGFRAVDMELLRKCPCPLFIVRPSTQTEKEVRVGVAIDANDDEPIGRELSLQLLKVSSSLTSQSSEHLHIISCWGLHLEKYLSDNIWITISKDELEQMVSDEKEKYEKSLHAIIDDSHISNEYKIHLKKGRAEELIPLVIEENNIDILVMGTVARTGISSFIIGNTAENILQKINCSLLALKPKGFISPVKAY